MFKSAIYLSIERKLKERLATEAETQHRSLANMLEWILIQYFRRKGGDGGGRWFTRKEGGK